MAFVIGPACIDVMDRTCMQECPVDCIYEGNRKLYINPEECIDCGACEPQCPVEAISSGEFVPAGWAHFAEDSVDFFTKPLPGRDVPVGSPGGAVDHGPIGADTAMVAGYVLDDNR